MIGHKKAINYNTDYNTNYNTLRLRQKNKYFVLHYTIRIHGKQFLRAVFLDRYICPVRAPGAVVFLLE